MEKGKAKESIESVANSLHDLQFNQRTINSKPTQESVALSLNSQLLTSERKAGPRLLSLCLGVLGSHLEDIIDDLTEIGLAFPPDIKLVLVAIARRRKILNDDILIALADSSWEILDISGSDVSDPGLCHVVDICRNLRAVDISRCSRLTSTGVSELLQLCLSLETLRWGGCPRSDRTARGCLSLLKPNLNNVEGECWEELDAAELTYGAQSLRWLVWPKIDKDSQEILTSECPRIIVNPKPSPFGFRSNEVPKEAFTQFTLDDPFVKDIDPRTWAVSGFISRSSLLPAAMTDELPIAEKFRLAFLERDTRLAAKRAKNARQHQRRAEKEWAMSDARIKALVLAKRASRS